MRYCDLSPVWLEWPSSTYVVVTLAFVGCGQGEEASVLAFYVFLWGLGLWGICRIHNQVSHRP